MFQISLVGSMLGGIYGILHDQVTFSISSEYFIKLKYQQFHYLVWGSGDRLQVSIIGFFATWWVGLFLGWFLARWFLPVSPIAVASRKILKSSIIIFAASLVFALFGGVLAYVQAGAADYSNWISIVVKYDIENIPSFVMVAYIHIGSYSGALMGLIVALIWVKKKTKTRQTVTG